MSATTRGFSLLELLIVLAVLGILVGIGSVFSADFLAQKRLDEAAISLSNSLRRASDDALTQSQEVTLTLAANSVRWKNEANQDVGAQTLPKGATLSPTGNLTFSGRGLPITAQSFSVSMNAGTKTLHLLPTGAVIIR